MTHGTAQRPLFKATIEQLEEMFSSQQGNDAPVLHVLVDELSYRKTIRARRLLEEVQKALRDTKPVPPPPPPPPEPPPPVTNAPVQILGAWTALEALSPQTFRQPQDWAMNRDVHNVVRLDGRRLPWEGDGERSRPGKQLYYQVLLGTVRMEPAVERLLTVYSDTRVERPGVRGETPLAVVVVDCSGRPVQGDAIALSSFSWALPRALKGDLLTLGGWPDAEKRLVAELDGRLRRQRPDGELAPLDQRTIMDAYQWLLGTLGIPQDLAGPPLHALRAYEDYRSREPPDPLLLNSFFLGDLAQAAALFHAGNAPETLRRYLGMQQPATRQNLLNDPTALKHAIRPAAVPPGRWPGPARRPLVLLQQASVNLALSELRDGGILAVNGPPGTGKTTLLRDITAAIIVERAERLLMFDDPKDAFERTSQYITSGNARQYLHKVNPALRGFEIVVASSNNRAVENVSAELPGTSAIASDAPALRYFTPLSDHLLGRETWGLIAAVLGNRANCASFRQGFWWDRELGLATYLAAATGTPQKIDIIDPATGTVTGTRTPRIVTEAQAPSNRLEALQWWHEVRTAFRQALERSRAQLKALESVRTLVAELPRQRAVLQQAGDRLQALEPRRLQTAAAHERARARVAAAEQKEADAAVALQLHIAVRPGLLARVLRTARYREWRRIEETRRGMLHDATMQCDADRTTLQKSAADLAHINDLHAGLTQEIEQGQHTLTAMELELEVDRRKLGSRLVDDAFFVRPHEAMQQESPWLTDACQRARDDVFIAAMALHKAFVDAAAAPLLGNLSVMMRALTRALPGADKEALLPDLWTSLFLIVPVVSTTFASVERMLGRLPPGSLGWLLIDEAGQALPQAAVGALMRARRAVIVGDPLQIEPIVPLPDTLTEAIVRRFGVEPTCFNAPAASAQTLADQATPYFGEFTGIRGARTVGVPLLVHRRCAEPMFSISNSIAYDRLMVFAKESRPSRIRDALGPSRWLHVQGSAQEKWCPEEGALVLELLRRLAGASISPDLYIITPFVIVQDRLRELIRTSRILDGWVPDAHTWPRERIGTVHTFQGREAEAIILVLGAPAQPGARSWAGRTPHILNVAVTRAREVLYVIGNRDAWQHAGAFQELAARLPRASPHFEA